MVFAFQQNVFNVRQIFFLALTRKRAADSVEILDISEKIIRE